MRRIGRFAGWILLVLSVTARVWGDGAFLDSPADTYRLLSYNPYWEAIFRTGIRRYRMADEFQRVLRAVEPNIACIQEIDPRRDREDVLAIFRDSLPLPEGEVWTMASGADNVIVSRYPIRWSAEKVVRGRGSRGRGHVLALIDLPDDSYETDVLVVAVHFVSGGTPDEIQARTVHGDTIVADLRRAFADGSVPAGTGVVLAGDFNAYGTDPRRHLDSLIRGDIADESTFGPDGSPDPSGVPMVDLLPVHNGSGSATWTWRDDTQVFEPYALDRIIFTGSLMSAEHSFVLNTSIMAASDLADRGLERADVALDLASGDFDHLPTVVDFRMK